MLDIKKYVYIIIASFGLLFVFYSSFNNQFIVEQAELSNKAIETNDYEYFLKFNTKYVSEELFLSDKVMINEVYNSGNDDFGYNILFFDLEYNYNEELNFLISISGVNDTYELEAAVSSYELLGVINLQLYYTDIVESIGDAIQSISISYEDDLIESCDVVINLADLQNIDDEQWIDGYTDNEAVEMFKVKSLISIFKNLIIYILVVTIGYFSCVLVYYKIVLKRK